MFQRSISDTRIRGSHRGTPFLHAQCTDVVSVDINPQWPPGIPMCIMDPNGAPQITLCPHCLCPLNIRQSYSFNFFPPVQLPIPPPTRPDQGRLDQHPANNTAVYPSPPPVYQQNSTPTPPPEPPTQMQIPENEQDHTACGENHCTSSSLTDYTFSEYSFNEQFEAELQAVEERYFSQ